MKIKTIFVLLFFAVAIIGIIAPINAASDSVSSEDKVFTIESKKKAASLKITWNANGGKIGSKKTTITTVKKGNNLNKLVTSPKRSGHTFKGWYTKKTGGKKIGANTKPAKSVTYYAQWSKKGSIDSKIVGVWWSASGPYYYFYSDGRFTQYKPGSGFVSKIEGKYSVSNGKVYFKERKYSEANSGLSSDFPKLKYKLAGTLHDMTSTYTLGSDNNGAYLSIANQDWYIIDRFTTKKVLERNKYYESIYRISKYKL